MPEPLLSIENLCVDFLSRAETTSAVKGISIQVNRGEIVALVGESGSGKSVTALSILRLLPEPPARYTSGRILFNEGASTVDLLKLPAKRLQEIRGHKIAMVFQEPMTSLNPVMSCGAQVAEALLQHKKLTHTVAKAQAIEWFRKVQLSQPEALYHRYPHQLSGGQKQRVMIAMALCCKPALLICDEPTTALDVTVQKEILQLLKGLQQDLQMGVIFITHDLGVVAQIADRVAIMYRGEIVEQNKTAILFKNPAHPYTKALIACRPALHPKGAPLPLVADFLKENPSPASPAILPQEQTFSKPHTRHVLVQVQNLVIQYPSKTNLIGQPTAYTTAVNGVSFEIYKGETLGLVGESGCGKTTVGRTLLRLLKPTSGQILFDGADSAALISSGEKVFRKEVQLVFQDPYASLNPRLTVQDALDEPMRTLGLYKTEKERRTRITELLERVGLLSSWRHRYPHQFSGGQRQRLVIARALAVAPRFLVCDESVSALDVSVQAQVLNLLNELKRDLDLTLLFISHDLSVVRYMSDRILVMKGGEIVESGDAEAVYRHPQSPYTQQLIAAVPQMEVV
jgi:peptide/nickel transport system ATP-binding protein